ncbi:ABC transporter ATP-binding protein [Thermodesulfobacterium sp. TA1]|uniref:ABC transporter ATP-binding protein n=1 Tax=Thermodesulfobacterium sp. TA1 TaxID=2234087 RepID=UPI001232385F|nr:ABC transporter ATP-binding protein [Thermodesulfobacterium sp. TA1]QER41786.1 ABC transporter ATP-binding protein [Thermodesulfobacterium sp. TA1]
MPSELYFFLRKIFSLIKPFWKTFFLGLFFAVISSLITGASTWAIKPIFNFVFVEKHYEYFIFVPLLMVVVFSLMGITSLLQAYFMKSVSAGVINNLRLKLFQKFLCLPVEKIAGQSHGQAVSKVINDTAQIEPILGEALTTIFQSSFSVIVLIAVALYQRWDLTLLAFITFPVIIFGSKALGTKTRKARKLAQASTGELTHKMQELLQGIKEIKLSPSPEKVVDLFAKELNRFYRWSLKITKYREGSKSLVDIVTGIGGAIIIGYGGFLTINGAMSPGSFLSVLTAILLIFNPIRKLSRSYTYLKEAQGAWIRIEEVLNLPVESGGNLKAFSPRQGFTFKEVYFRYFSAHDWVLKNVNLFLPANKIITFVGPSGSGKTTLASLLPRFFDPQKGEILLDGYNLKEFELKSLRNLFGMVLQEPFLFNLSIKENLLMAKPEASEEEIIEACKLAKAHDFILDLPYGYDTVLGEEGFNLSGGQKQRIALARVFLKKPPIIILDEATSQLDSITEEAIQEALDRLKGSHTIIVIAHRLSTVTKADLIFVFDKGEIVSQGTHQKLLDISPLYRNLYQTFQRCV